MIVYLRPGSKYVSKRIHGLMFESFSLGTTYNVRVIIKENLLLDNYMLGSKTTYGVLYIWRKYSVQVSIEGNSPLDDKPELYFQGLQSFFSKVSG